MKFTLIDDVENYLKFWSVKFNLMALVFGALNALSVLADYLPLIQEHLPKGPYAMLMLICIVASLISRLVKQPALTPEATDASPGPQ